jgi:hypothetical protein
MTLGAAGASSELGGAYIADVLAGGAWRLYHDLSPGVPSQEGLTRVISSTCGDQTLKQWRGRLRTVK